MSLKDLFSDIYSKPFDYFKVRAYPNNNKTLNDLDKIQFDDFDLDGGSFCLYIEDDLYGIYDDGDIYQFILYYGNKIEHIFTVTDYMRDCLKRYRDE